MINKLARLSPNVSGRRASLVELKNSTVAKLANVLVYEWQAWSGFLISHLIADYCRKEAGFEDDIDDLKDALSPNIKAVLPQICLSRSIHFPGKRAELIKDLRARGLLVLNQAVTDITKRNLHALVYAAGISEARACEEGDPSEFLFIKSNLNWGGEAEQRLPENLQGKFEGFAKRSIDKHDQYYIAQRKDLDPETWHDDSIVIERYIQNDENSFYRVYAFGDAVVIVKGYTIDLIKKLCGDKRDVNCFHTREEIAQGRTALPARLNNTLKKFLQQVPLDYFCLDIVHDRENYFVIDLNLTPWSGEQEQTREAAEFLCQGAHRYIKRALMQ